MSSTYSLERSANVGSNTKDPKSWKEQAATWVFQQGVSTVLLVAILCYGAYISQYVVDVAVPKHLDAITTGFKMQAEAHEKAVDKMTNEWVKERELTRELLREMQRTHARSHDGS